MVLVRAREWSEVKRTGTTSSKTESRLTLREEGIILVIADFEATPLFLIRRPQSLLCQMGILPDEGEVQQCVGEILIGHRGVGKHTGSRMAFPDSTDAFLVCPQM